jgi:hypothetical protein
VPGLASVVNRNTPRECVPPGGFAALATAGLADDVLPCQEAAADSLRPLARRGLRIAGRRDSAGCPRLPGPGWNGRDAAGRPLIFWKKQLEPDCWGWTVAP